MLFICQVGLAQGAGNAGYVVNVIEETVCNLGIGVTGWYREVSLKNNEWKLECLLALPQNPDIDDSRPNVVKVKIDGKLINLKKVAGNPKLTAVESKKWHSVDSYTSQDGGVKVKIYSKLEYDSCEEVVETCCGQQYIGSLEIATPQGKKTFKVKQSTGS